MLVDMRVSLGKVLVIVWCLVVVFACSWSLLHAGLFHVHDTVHAARIAEMSQALLDGHFPVRWVQHFGLGYGMPLFNFYAPLPYYVGSVLFLSGLPMEVVIKSLLVLSSLGTWIGGYVLGKWLTDDDNGGLIAATAITMAPYRAVNLFVRGAISEAWGIMGTVLIVAGTVGIVKHKKGSWWLLVTGWVVQLLSHNLTTMMFLPLILVFTVALLIIEQSRYAWVQAVKLGLAVVVGVALSAFYVLPAVLEKQFISLETVVAAFPYHQHFVFGRQWVEPMWGYGGSAPLPYNDQSHFLGYGQMVLVAMTLLLAVIHFLRNRRLDKRTGLLGVVLGLMVISLVLMHPRSQPIWQLIPLLQILQFPWRWLGEVIVWLGVIGALGLTYIGFARLRGMVTAAICLALVVSNAMFFRPEAYLANNEQWYITDPVQISQQTRPGWLDYLPRDFTRTESARDVARIEPSGSYEVLENKTHTKKVLIQVDQPAVLIWETAYFPGWEVRVEGKKVDLTVTPAGEISLELPAGKHLVEVLFARTPVRWVADGLSALAWVGLGVYVLYWLKVRAKVRG